jgi:hypothetical protein
MKNKSTKVLIGITLLVVMTSCTAPPAVETESPVSPTTTEPSTEEPAATPEPTENPYGDWLEYKNPDYGFRFLYPDDWFGPDISDTDGFLRVEVGSDQVYPYGTSREDQITTDPDSYYVLIQYVENREGRTWDDYLSSGWIDTYLALQEKGDGQFILTPRLVATRIGEVSLGDFSGLMYLATIPDNAQTERAYTREVVLFDSELNWLRITAFPNNVQIADLEKWKNDYARVDTANLEIFLTLLNSIEIE